MDGKRSIKNANPCERRILRAIFLFAALPVILILLLFYGLFSDLIYTYIETDLSGRFLDRFIMLSALILFYYIIFARMVFRFVNRIFGPYNRILRELDQIISGESRRPLRLRENDYAKELVDRINKLIENLP